MKKALSIIFAFLLTAGLFLPLFGVTALAKTPASPEIASSCALLYNLDYDQILFEQNEKERIYPASFTKLLTALLAYEYRAQHGSVDVTVTEEMLSGAGGTSMNLKAGEILPLDSLLAGLVVQNANDAALVLASVVGGSVSSFVSEMNEKAEALGMVNSYFANPTGVDNAMMYSSLSDVLILCKTLYKINDFMVLSETAKVTIPATNLTGERVYTNKNALVPFSYVTDYYMKNMRGFSAGYTANAGYCVASSRKSATGVNIVLVSGGIDRDEEQRGRDITSYRDAKTLLEWAEKNYAAKKLVEADTIFCEKAVRLSGSVDHVILVAGADFSALLPADFNAETDLKTVVRADETYTAPLWKNSKYGEADLIVDGVTVGTVDLVAGANVPLSRWLVVWDGVVRFFSQGPAHTVLVLLITAAVLYVIGLLVTVWIQHLKTNREYKRAIREMEEEENLRLKKVREKERASRQKRFRQARRSIVESIRVISGESEALGDMPKAPYHRSAVRTPEKYHRKPAPGVPLPPRPESTPKKSVSAPELVAKSQRPKKASAAGTPVSAKKAAKKTASPKKQATASKNPAPKKQATASKNPAPKSRATAPKKPVKKTADKPVHRQAWPD